MRLNKLEIFGFKNENIIVTLEFSKMNASIIYGKNGIGKTTLLEIISAIFNKNIAVLK